MCKSGDDGGSNDDDDDDDGGTGNEIYWLNDSVMPLVHTENVSTLIRFSIYLARHPNVNVVYIYDFVCAPSRLKQHTSFSLFHQCAAVWASNEIQSENENIC